ncbi:MAG: hypothetical protein NZ959_08575 [Armatimonadetes bacterium]|nr:hypothetical protein [Armatimonadota bacterium]MDW8121709.1 hypothetical protein [Armatimonadota bacterium]
MRQKVPLWATVCIIIVGVIIVGAIAWWNLRPRPAGEIGQPAGTGMGPPPEVMRQIQQFGGTPRPGGAGAGAPQANPGGTR